MELAKEMQGDKGRVETPLRSRASELLSPLPVAEDVKALFASPKGRFGA